MIQALLDRIRDHLNSRWQTRMTEIRTYVISLTPDVRAAYIAGYRRGYWEGVEDLAQVSVERPDDVSTIAVPGVH